ncbi:hypothetical protein G5V59_23145 [Nocardioides sp. W3-2-3]|nr:hypothetical protein [Nocardioides convexus]
MTTSPTTGPATQQRGGFSLDVEERSIGNAFRDWIGRLRSGDPGALPSVLGLVVLTLIFMQVSDKFLGRYNIGNLPGQGAYIAVIAMGLVFVLLLGEIDLSAGTAGGAAAGIAAVGIFHGQSARPGSPTSCTGRSWSASRSPPRSPPGSRPGPGRWSSRSASCWWSPT